MWMSVIDSLPTPKSPVTYPSPSLPIPHPSAPLPTPHSPPHPSPSLPTPHPSRLPLPSHSPFPSTPLPPLPNIVSPPPPPPPSAPHSSPSPTSADSLSAVLSRIIRHLPPAHFAAAYGSGVFPQSSSPSSSPPLLDLLLAVDDPVAWHARNLALHPSHYSFLKHLGGPQQLAAVQDMPAHVYYNANAVLDGRSFKYGVISTARLTEDLTQWTTLYLSGRLHKPVRVLTPPPPSSPLPAALSANLQSALTVALLLAPGQYMTDTGVFALLTSLSYLGDIRMGVAEDPAKVANIVRGSFLPFQRLYTPLLSASEHVELAASTVSADGHPESVWRIKDAPHHRQRMLEALPKNLRELLWEDVGGSGASMTVPGQQQLRLRASIAFIVKVSSLQQSTKGLFTVGFRNSLWYALRKVGKAWGRG